MSESIINTGVIAGSLIAIFTVLFFFVKMFRMVSDIYQTSQNRNKLLDEWQTEIPQMNRKLNDISTLVNTIFTYLKNNDNKFVQSHSPISLTKDGKRLVDVLNIEGIIDVNYEHLSASIDGKKPNNAYDIQELSMEIMQDFLKNMIDEEILTSMKKFAYQEGVSLDALYLAFSIVLRDKILQEKGFTLEDVDKSNPDT